MISVPNGYIMLSNGELVIGGPVLEFLGAGLTRNSGGKLYDNFLKFPEYSIIPFGKDRGS